MKIIYVVNSLDLLTKSMCVLSAAMILAGLLIKTSYVRNKFLIMLDNSSCLHSAKCKKKFGLTNLVAARESLLHFYENLLYILSDSCGYNSLATRIMTQIPEEDDPSQRQNKLNQEGDYQARGR